MTRHRLLTLPLTAALAAAMLTAVAPVGSAATTDAVRLDPVSDQVLDASPNMGPIVNGIPIFQLLDPTTGQELWVPNADGTGLTLLKDIAVGTASSGVSTYGMGVVSGGAYFSADDGVHGPELWFTDGTPANTRLVKDIVPGIVGGYRNTFTAVGSKVVFRVSSSDTLPQLWVTDGTAEGTQALTSIAFDPLDDGVQGVAELPGQGKAVFIARYRSTPPELWVTDGTVGGTQRVKTFAPESNSMYMGMASGSFAYLYESNSNALWRTDGTEAGTVVVKRFDGSNPPAGLADFGGRLVFKANTLAAGTEPWITDGTEAGTVSLGDIRPGVDSSNAYNTGVYAGRLYFSANDGVHGRELWSTDGTAAGTVLHADTLPGADEGYAEAMVGRGGRVYYIAYDAAGNIGTLWSVDAKTPGTQSAVTVGAGALTEVMDLRLAGGFLYASGRVDEFTTADGTVKAYNVYRAQLAGAQARLTRVPTAMGKARAAQVGWRTASSPDDAVTGYVVRIYTRASGGKAYKTRTVSASARSYRFTGLKSRTRYWVTVTPVAGGTWGRQSARVAVKTR